MNTPNPPALSARAKDTIKAGTRVLLTMEWDADYRVNGLYVAHVDFSPRDMLDKWLAANPEPLDEATYIAFLIANGNLGKLDCEELHLRFRVFQRNEITLESLGD